MKGSPRMAFQGRVEQCSILYWLDLLALKSDWPKSWLAQMKRIIVLPAYKIAVRINWINTCMMFNFMCQLDWAMGCPDIWLNIFLGVSVRVFLGEISIWISSLSKAHCPSQCRWASASPLKAWIEQKGWEKENSLSLSLFLFPSSN